MTTPVKCTACDGRGWKKVTRRGQVAAVALGMETSSREDCLYCDGGQVLVEMFEWEVFVTADGTDELGPCGISAGQATSIGCTPGKHDPWRSRSSGRVSLIKRGRAGGT
ncbi:hypothetical protein [Microbispora hainanensis]|uniref:Uncharacterized protein n=1 Tax=Microbispora hainanensis TaxID=568844 RepID=A0A544XVA7_9ACTN|nr:hypothetical protein [Microbispora hainanensis]TQS08392.1 hypothetical protein FLX08_39030 [Microbispora hainanensis]